MSGLKEGLIGPYRITESLGVGGMGEVYKAHDERLDRWVAIKRIRPDKEESFDNRERFRREARAAARLNHSAIVHVYDIFQDGDSDCIVMEFVAGVSLNALIAEKPLDPYRAAAIGREIAAGLAEAHRQGIVHRDLKTENIIITKRGHAKILDFGLAKPLVKGDLDTSLTGQGQVVGTSRAMPPEYVSGDEVDHRADLFALGVLLYEALTGQSPFKAHNTLATLKRVLLHDQAPVVQLRPEVPMELSALIDMLLEKEPDDRPSSADEVASALGMIASQESSGSIEVSGSGQALLTTASTALSVPASLFSAQRRKLIAVGLGIGALLIAGLVAVFFATRTAPSPESVPIVLADFVDRTGEGRWADSLQYLLRTALEESRIAKVLSHHQVQDVLLRMESDLQAPIDEQVGLEICKREGAEGLVRGDIIKIGSQYTISARILDPEKNGETIFSTKETAKDQGEITSALDEVARQVRQSLGESFAEIRDTEPLETVTTPNLDALESYSRAIKQFDEGRARRDVIALLEHAISIDPEFAMAHARLGVLYRNESPSNSKTYEHFKRADELSDHLTRNERLYVEGWMAQYQGRVEDAIQTWSLVRDLYPEPTLGLFNRGTARNVFQNDFARALEDFEQIPASKSRPQFWRLGKIWGSLCQLALGRYDEAMETIEALKTGDENLWNIGRAIGHTVRQEHEQAETILESMLDSSSLAVKVLAAPQLAILYADLGDFETAVETSKEAANLARGLSNTSVEMESRFATACYLEYGSDRTAFRDALLSGMRAVRANLEQNPQAQGSLVTPLLLSFGKIAARNGLLDEAEETLARIQHLTEEDGFTAWDVDIKVLNGEVLLARNRGEEAVDVLVEAVNAASTNDLFQAHESLARAYEAQGATDAAIEEYEWMVAHRGQAFTECRRLCGNAVLNVTAWLFAHERLGALYDLKGDHQNATRYYQAFIERWRRGDSKNRSAAYLRSEKRLAELVDDGGKSPSHPVVD